jgi:dolichol-phosphate mannosyltransferase
VEQVSRAASAISENFEIVLVDDGSPDEAWLRIQEECGKDVRVKGIRLSRNFGQHFAITAGLAHASGEAVVVMDCDLQDDPKYIPELYRTLQQGYGIVFAKKQRRRHGFIKNLFSNLFYKAISWISDFKLDPDMGNYTILSRRAVDAFLSFNDYR